MSSNRRVNMGIGGWTALKPAAAPSRKVSIDARKRKRLKVSLPVHLRPFDARFTEIEDVGQVVDFTRDGLYFKTCMPHYFVGMRLIVTFPYGDKVSAHRKFLASVVRLEHLETESRGVALRFLL
ncbi:MAG TPA: PilZ domain-containing protein [Candidatus Acidoferrales bacterium]|nr:PilZ domain-containing protein [Candidatus Acidoferrales bacterium]